MDLKDIENIVDDTLKDFPDILNRGDLAKVLDVNYASVPSVVDRDKIPTMTVNEAGSWNRIKVHKAVLRKFLIDRYTDKNKCVTQI